MDAELHSIVFTGTAFHDKETYFVDRSSAKTVFKCDSCGRVLNDTTVCIYNEYSYPFYRMCSKCAFEPREALFKTLLAFFAPCKTCEFSSTCDHTFRSCHVMDEPLSISMRQANDESR